MAKIRVIRLLEYTYDSVEQMDNDMSHWHVQTTYRPNLFMKIKSVVLPLDILKDEDEALR